MTLKLFPYLIGASILIVVIGSLNVKFRSLNADTTPEDYDDSDQTEKDDSKLPNVAQGDSKDRICWFFKHPVKCGSRMYIPESAWGRR
ncbi:hypothetical protein BsWGS_07214 [Bradybaena similaris]